MVEGEINGRGNKIKNVTKVWSHPQGQQIHHVAFRESASQLAQW